ncbi:7TM diverse intracellular signaling domain-containing protein [Caenimonas aquaedulcis]|uniref:GGDEF domain-containing protein n=1 Tax=Caenimonas aquaedulcis TaxID=2793270 RepID=A0A931H398_9BURK|nr:7TM diverse intracellular signaling domain-containing protein [Caenimonas aquaedulcis]MBG9387749.1 hypothetical protein [Caenimonas aquaedulcis]
MLPLELAIWSAAAGAIALVVVVGLVDFALVRSRSAAKGAGYNLATLVFVLSLSGLPPALLPELRGQALAVLQVLIGPLCGCLGNYWVRGWLGARHRDRLMDSSLLAYSIFAPFAGLACLALPQPQQLPAAAVIVLVNSGLIVWLSVRAWLMGDALALGIAAGALLMLPAAGGLYAMALGIPGIGPGWQAAIAFNSVACVAVLGMMFRKRHQLARRMRGDRPVHSQFDAVTRLPSGASFVRALIRAQERRRITRRDGAVLAVILFDTDRIVAQTGPATMNELYLQVAQCLQQQLGVMNPVGRYWDRCFVGLAETIHSPAAMRTLGLRVATSLRMPMEVNAPDGRVVTVRLEVGVGVVHLGREPLQVEDVLHDAQHLAEAARCCASRAATRDPVSGQVVPVEHAQLGKRRRIRAGKPPRIAQA